MRRCCCCCCCAFTVVLTHCGCPYSYLYGSRSHYHWNNFITYFQPYSSVLDPLSLITFLREDSTKKTVFLGVDESLAAENPSSFASDLARLIDTNSSLRCVPPEGRVFVVATSLSLARISDVWLYNAINNQTRSRSGRLVCPIHLPLIDIDAFLSDTDVTALLAKLDPSSARSTAITAIRLSGGHPRTLSFTLARIEKALAEPSAAFPMLTAFVRVAATCTFIFLPLWLCLCTRRTASVSFFRRYAADDGDDGGDDDDDVGGGGGGVLQLSTVSADVPLPLPVAVIHQAAIGASVHDDSIACGNTRFSITTLAATSGTLLNQESTSPRLRIVPALLYSWSARQSSDLDDLYGNHVKSLVSDMFKGCLEASCNGFEQFMHAYLALAWGSSIRANLGALFPWFTTTTSKALRPIEVVRTVATLRAIDASSLQIAASRHYPDDRVDFRMPCAVRFAGQGNDAQRGFDCLCFQPALESERPLLVLVEFKWSVSTSNTLTLPAMCKKVRLTAVQLAPYLPGTRSNNIYSLLEEE